MVPVQEVEERAPRSGEGHPDQAVGAGGEVVGEPGEAVGEDVGGTRARAGEPQPPEPVGPGLRHHQEGLVGRQADTVRELEPVHHDLRGPARLPADEAARTGVFEDVALPVAQGEPAAGVGHEDRAVLGDGHVAAQPQRFARGGGERRADRAGRRVDPQQPAVGVADQELPVRKPPHPQRPAAGAGDLRHPPGDGVHAQDASVGHTGQEVPGSVEGEVFGAVPVDREEP
ncbi:hypothetical protein SMD11_6585 [Streptomyces albireticuli]|uniref:Uncharacterized protein n=1 Tax=Streptomyces albireticuli TaxID=1940 RepID=A0A1Z2LD72_9ACTN|nr:hypothetical protein SMD11_6585 [Streptomyces albireticuli]